MNLHPIQEFDYKSVPAIVKSIKNAEEDFEWYPTTDAILEVIKSDVNEHFNRGFALLDCGAGDGRVLKYLSEREEGYVTCYAIEKCEILIQRMDKDIFIVGSDFRQQALIDKKVDVIFSNPPYSEYEDWAVKIISEANAQYIYLVIPTRWRSCKVIKEAIQKRDAKVEALGEFDFMNAERRARAQVEILRIELCYSHGHGLRIDPFRLWFEEHFHLQIAKEERSKYEWKRNSASKMGAGLESALVPGSDIVNVLEGLYRRDLDNLFRIYKALEDIECDLLNEMEINIESVMGSLRLKIEGLKDLYWQELFKNFEKVTSRLCVASRKAMLDKLTRHTHIDFTASNVRAVMIWVIKNANVYLDDQLVKLVERMTEHASVQMYVSNQRTFGKEMWRYGSTPHGLERYKLDYRFVLHRCGGFHTSSWAHERNQNGGLTSGASDLISDIITVANNIGFDTTHSIRPDRLQWQAGAAETFAYYCHKTCEKRDLVRVRAFKNGNLHLQFAPDFMCRLNVEFGRLKGWLKSKQEAVDELQATQEQVADGFYSNLVLEPSNFLRLTYGGGQSGAS